MLRMMLIFSLLNRKCFCSVLNVVSGMKGANGSWKKEWMVTPPALMAAIPVGATMTVRLGDSFFRLRRKVVFPVPAFPVRKRWVPVFSILFARHAVVLGYSLFPNVSILFGKVTAFI